MAEFEKFTQPTSWKGWASHQSSLLTSRRWWAISRIYPRRDQDRWETGLKLLWIMALWKIWKHRQLRLPRWRENLINDKDKASYLRPRNHQYSGSDRNPDWMIWFKGPQVTLSKFTDRWASKQLKAQLGTGQGTVESKPVNLPKWLRWQRICAEQTLLFLKFWATTIRKRRSCLGNDSRRNLCRFQFTAAASLSRIFQQL